MPANGPDIVKRYDRLEGEAHNHRRRWEEMAPYIAQSRVGIQTAFSPGEKQNRQVFDSTTGNAAELMAMFIAGSIMNPGQQWGAMSMRDPRVREDDAVREWLEESRDRQLRRLAASMFYAEGPESLIDWGGFGTGFLLVDEQPPAVHERPSGFRGFFCEAQRTGRFVIADGPNGLVDTAMRKFKLTARLMRDRWGEAALPEKTRAVLRQGKPDELFTIIHAILPRPVADQRAGAGATAMPFASVWVEKESKTIIHESGYRQFPGAVYRYHRTPGEVYGRGRGDIAFPDTWTLNTSKRMGLEDFALKQRPPILVAHNSVMGTLRITPGGPTTLNTHGRPIRDVLTPFETGSNPQISMLKEEELRKSIRQIFFVDQILMLMEVQKSEMTAFEFAKKLELLFTLMGPVYGRTEHEFLRQIWDVTFDLLLEAGEFSPPPPAVFETDGMIDVVFENPLARSRRVSDVEAITLAVNDLSPLAQVFPQMWDGFDPDKTRQHVFAVRGVPAKVTRNEDEIAAVRQARQQQQESEQQLDEAGMVAEAAGKAAPALKLLQGQQGAAA